MTKKRDRWNQRILQRLEEAEIHPDDKAVLRDFATELRRDASKGRSREGGLLKYGLTIARHREPPTTGGNQIHGLSLQEILDDPEAAEAFQDWLDKRRTARSGHTKSLSDKTKTHYLSAIRAMGELLTERDGRPDHIEALPATLVSDSDPTPHPSEILYWDNHIIPILDCQTVNIRDKALCALAWESGARPWEIEDLVWNDLDIRDDYAVLSIEDGKTTDRDIRLVASLPYLRLWRRDHPIHDTLDEDERVPGETVMWSRLEEPEPLRDIKDLPTDAGKRAGVDRRTNLRAFRKSRASILAMSPEVSEEALRYRFGWTPKSSAPAHYKARFGTESEDQIARADGIEIELADEHEDPAPVRCPNCENWTPRHKEACLFCTVEIDIDAAEDNTSASLKEEQELREKTQRLLAKVAEGKISPETIETVENFTDVIDEEPDLVERAGMFLDTLEERERGE